MSGIVNLTEEMEAVSSTDEPKSMQAHVDPDHYKHGGVECIDVIKAVLGQDGVNNFCLGNVIKYVFRFADKNGMEDLLKAREYLNIYIRLNGGVSKDFYLQRN